MIKVWKAIIDTMGHYARPDIVRLEYQKASPEAVASLAVEAFEQSPRGEVEKTAEQHDVSREKVESVIERLARKPAEAR